MKKTLLFAFALLFATAMMAQNRAVLLQETFDGTSLPTGWSIVGQNNNWSVSATNNAGGEPNEMHLTWSPQFNGMTRLVSPAVDLTGINSVVFSFKHALDNYSGSNTIGIATTSDGGTTWNQGWSQGYSASNSYSVSQEINTPDMGQANVQFCIFFNGSSYNINDWFFDDITAFTLENLDLGLESATLNDFIGSGETSFGIKVFNYGVTAVTSVTASYTVEGFEPVTETFTTNIPSLGTQTLNFTTTTLLIPGNYNVAYSIDLVNGQEDDVTTNNMLEKSVSVAIGATDKIPMIEHFSSSTCGPCVSVNTQMLNFCNNNAGRFTYTKYQMNWPGNGDPYYTEEGGTRRTYYGVSAVPQCFLDGEDQGYAAVQQTVFNEHADRTAFFDVRGSFSVEGNTITVKADVMPYIDAEARVYISVNEKETHGNVGSNGETSFHHVFMKMLPNAQGTSVSFTSCEPQHLEFTQDMSGTHVEEMSDLEVSIWVQNYTTKETFNSHFAYEYTDVHPYPVENLTVTDQAPTKGTMSAMWDAPANSNPTGYDVYINGVLVAEGITETTYSFESEPDVFYVVGVVALYEGDMTSVKVLASASSSLQDMGLVNYGSPYVELTVAEPEADVYVTNGNYASQTPIEITAITETNDAGEQYLVIEPSVTLPATINAGEDFTFNIAPAAAIGRSVAETTVKVESDGGEVIFNVTVDGELLQITEVSTLAKIYPNPASNQVQIEAANAIESVEIYNMLGALVQTVSANGKLVNVSTTNLSDGVYFFSIRQSDGSVINQRVVVSH